jgi:hypothetical protein
MNPAPKPIVTSASCHASSGVIICSALQRCLERSSIGAKLVAYAFYSKFGSIHRLCHEGFETISYFLSSHTYGLHDEPWVTAINIVPHRLLAHEPSTPRLPAIVGEFQVFRAKKSSVECIAGWFSALDLFGSFRAMVFDVNDLFAVVFFQEQRQVYDAPSSS